MFCEATFDHDEIREWARVHGARPAEKLPDHVDGDEPLLAFLFESLSERAGRVVAVSWEDFFLKFDSLGLAFVAADQMHKSAVEYNLCAIRF
jgi:hypothetical protein